MKLMDVTLRESVYYGSGIDYSEALDYLQNIESYIRPEEIEYIEICYINTTTEDHLNYNAKFLKEAYSICKGKYKLVAMMHPGEADISKWDADAIRCLSMVRIVCGGTEIPDSVRKYVNYFHHLGIEVGINISFAMRKSLEKNAELYKKCVDYQADYVYFADSSGSALIGDIDDLCNLMNEHKKQNKTGFHLHDHLSLSFANAIRVCENHIDITDVSITGAGRGGGNLKTEFIIPFLVVKNGGVLQRELFHRLLNYIGYFNALVKRNNAIYGQLFLDTLSGFFRLALKQQDDIAKAAAGDGHKYIDLVFDSVGKEK